MAIKYTDSMIAEIRAAGSFTYNSANAFAVKHNIPIRSVIAKVRAMNIDYEARDPKTAKKVVGRAKSDVVKSIEASLGVTLASLNKMTTVDLEQLEQAVA